MSYSRIQVAVNVPQSEIPLTSAIPNASLIHPSFPIGPSAFSPTPLTSPSPVQRLVEQYVYSEGDDTRKEYDLVAVPITNPSWQARWEKMCLEESEESTSVEVDMEVDGSWNKLGEHASVTLPQRRNGKKRKVESIGKDTAASKWRAGNDGSAFKRGEVNVTRTEEMGYVIGVVSQWLELDSESEGIRLDSELALNQELSYCQHLRVGDLVLPPIRNDKYLTDYARAIRAALATWNLNLILRIPLVSNSGLGEAQDPYVRSWDWWNTIRHICGYDARLSVALELPSTLPSSPTVALHRWNAEPLKTLFIPCSSFIPNAKHFPVLSKACQTFIRSVIKFRPTIVLEGIKKGLHQSGGSDAYVGYIRYLEKTAPEKTPVEKFAHGYQDYLQSPLQPLMDNLGDDTYEGFERDPVKYRQYEEAIYQALLDRPSSRPIRVFVCGAGRGPLVSASLSAASRSGRRIELTAVEKNPNVFVILQERKALEWGNKVDLVFSDMRDFNPKEKADILVSELLGSFGDNELSPECLDSVMRCLDDGGISIPSSYKSLLAPITTSKLHAELLTPSFKLNNSEGRPAEQPYVVMLNAVHILSNDGGHGNWEKIQECWSFSHGPQVPFLANDLGLPLNNHHNIRTTCLTFHIPSAGICHGFAGYFEAVLYNNVTISIHPERGDHDMLSWFPIFFPLTDPLYLPGQSELDVHMFRLSDRKKVWFEWSAEVFLPISSFILPPSRGSMSAATEDDSVRISQLSNGRHDAFVNATQMPINADDSMSSAQSQSRSHQRIKIGQSCLHNPGGKASWIGL